MGNWFRGLKLNQKFTVTTLIFIFIPLFGMMCFGFRSIKKNAIDHGVNEAVTATDLTCAEVNAKANACSMVVDTLQEYEPLEKYLLHLRRGEEISEIYYQQFRNARSVPDPYFCHGRWFSGAAADPVPEGKDEKLRLVPKLSGRRTVVF